MALLTTRRRFLAGIAAITVIPIVPVQAQTWTWSMLDPDKLSVAIDELPDIPWTAEEVLNYRLGGGWDSDPAVIEYRRSGRNLISQAGKI